MPSPATTAKKRERVTGSSLLTDGIHEELLDQGSSPAPTVGTRPGSAPAGPLAGKPEPAQTPFDLPTGKGTDQAKIQALMTASINRSPALAIKIKGKGNMNPEKANLKLDPDTMAKWKSLALAQGVPISTLLCDEVFPWVKANADATSLIWARQQLMERRRVAQLHQRAALGSGEDLKSGGSGESIYYPLALLNSVKSLWGASKLKKKGFLEASIFLYLAIHAPEAPKS